MCENGMVYELWARGKKRPLGAGTLEVQQQCTELVVINFNAAIIEMNL